MKLPTPNTKSYVRKNVSVTHISAELSVLQRKLVNAFLYNAYDTLLTAKTHTLPLPLLAEMIGFDSRNQKHLREAIKGLVETGVEWDMMGDDGEEVWEVSTLLSFARVHRGVCSYRYDPSLAEKLFDPSIYSKINLSVIRSIRSSHALALYENCHRYIGTGRTAWWELETFRKLMGVNDSMGYREFKILNRDVIKPAIKEVNKVSNILVEMHTRRTGRRVSALQFSVLPNPQLSLEGIDEDEVTGSQEFKELQETGVSQKLAAKWLREFGLEYVREKLDLVAGMASGGKITSSKQGLLRKAIEDDYSPSPAPIIGQPFESSEDILRMRIRETEALRDKLEEQKRDIEKRFRAHGIALIDAALSELSDAERALVGAEFNQGLDGVYAQDFGKRGFGSPLLQRRSFEFWMKRGVDVGSIDEFARQQGVDLKSLTKQLEEIEGSLQRPWSLYSRVDEPRA